MSQTKAALEALDLAHMEYKQHVKLLQKALSATVKNERSITNKMSTLSNALREINASYTAWSSKSGLSDEDLASSTEKYNTKWLEDIWEEVDDFQDQVDQYLESEHPTPVLPTDHQLETTKGQFESLSLDINSRIEVLLSKTLPTTQTLNTASLDVYDGLFTEMHRLFTTDLQLLMDKLCDLDPTHAVEHSKQLEQYKRSHHSNIMKIRTQLADQRNTTTTSTSAPTRSQTKSIEMEKSKAPSFSGDTLDYPEFKRGWQKVPGIHWDDANQVEQIKYKVNAETRQLISRCNTMEEVWMVLDDEFAKEEEVVNAVDAKLQSLRIIECTVPEYIVKLRNYLPTLETALKSVNGFEHLSAPTRVEFLVSKFDQITLKDWDYYKAHNTGSTYERFTAFLQDQYDACRSAIARSKVAALTPIQLHQKGSVNLTASAANDCRRCLKWISRDSPYTCPACGRGSPANEKIHHCLEHCGVYVSMSVKERSDCVEQAKWCPIHMIGTHTYADCNMKTDSRYICGINGCTKHHHPSLHGSTSPFIASVYSTHSNCIPAPNSGNILLSMQTVSMNEDTANFLFDNCATCSLITEPAAKRLNLVGESLVLELTTVTSTVQINSVLYRIPFKDTNNETHIVKVWQVEKISEFSDEVDISTVKHLFSSHIQQNWESIALRPTGAIDILLGSDCLGLHPVDLEIRSNMRILSSSIDSSMILVGSHPSITSAGLKFTDEASTIMYCNSYASVNRISVRPICEYFEKDDMGIQPPRRCGNCRNCKDCSFMGHFLSQKEQYESQVIESKINYDQSSGQFIVAYPFTADPKILPNNRVQVIKIAEREEKRLTQNGYLDAFNQEFQKMQTLGALEKISDQELAMWGGAKHYVSLHPVINLDSATTPFRLTTNSSLSNRNGLSLNSILMKGHDTLSDQWDVVLRWRTYETALCTDVTKAYYSMRTGEVEKFVRLVVWRDGDRNQPWSTYGFRTVSFGDKPAASFLEIAIRRTAEKNKDIDPVAAIRIRDDRYVDDMPTGGTPDEVARFKGKEDENLRCDGTIPTILSKGSLFLKVMVSSGDSDQQKIAKLGGKILGTEWNPTSDQLFYNFTVTLVSKDKSLLPITTNNFSTFDHSLLTPSNLLHIINKLYDLTGLIALMTIKLRIGFRRLFKSHPTLEWNTLLPPGPDKDHWLGLIHLLVQSDSVSFNRCIKPSNTVGACELITFFDGSDDAFASVIYIRWELADGSIFVTLLCSKARVTPLKRISTPRSELNGAVVAARLTLSAVRSVWSRLVHR